MAAPASASPERSERTRRQTFTAKDEPRILADIDRAAETRGIGWIPRREELYSSTLSEWRRQRDAGAFSALVPGKRGPKTAGPNPLSAEVAALQRNNARLTQRLARAEAVIDIQKNLGAAGPPAGIHRRRALTEAVVALAPASGLTAAACAALGVSRASVQRRAALPVSTGCPSSVEGGSKTLPLYATSNNPAAPMPPPTHIVTTTSFAPRRLPSINACPTILAPDIP